MIRSLSKFVLIIVFWSGCAYFNTFYLAQKNFKDAETLRKRENGAVNSNTKKKYNDAIKWSKEIFDKHSGSRYVDDSMYIVGMSYYHLQEYVLARTIFDRLIEAFPESKFVQDARYYKARSHLGLNQYEEARMVLNELVNTDDRSMKGRAGLALAEITFLNEQWDELLNAAQAIIDSDPEQAELVKAIVYKGEALYQLERYDECITTLEKLHDFDLEPELRFTTNSLIAQSKAELGNFEEASTYLRNMENRGEFIPYEPRIRLEMGKIYELQGDKELAIDTYKKMSGDYPDSLAAKEAWYRVGIILIDDLSNAQEAKDAFDMVNKGKAKATEPWFVEAQIKAAQIDSMNVRLERIEKSKDDLEALAHARFSLAELYTYSFNRPDSALTQYRIIIEKAPDTEYAVMSDFFLRRYELIESGNYSDETEKDMMKEIIERYPNHDFTSKLKVHAGIIDASPDMKALRVAEVAKFSGKEPEVFIPLYQAVSDSFPNTRSAYQARFIIAYSYEHDADDLDKALKLYEALASEEPKFISKEFVEKAREKLEFYAREPEMKEEIRKYIAGYVTRQERGISSQETGEQTSETSSGTETGYSGFRKVRARNERIRSRYFTD